MKRFLFVGERYGLFKRRSLEAIQHSTDTTLTGYKRYINKTTSKAYGLLVRPWFRQAASLMLVALVYLKTQLSSCNFSVLRTSCIYLGLFFMCLQAAIAKEPLVPETDRAVLVADSIDQSILLEGVVLGDSLPDWFWNTKLKVVNHPEGLDHVQLSDFKDKLFVLNFWSTGCVPCVRTMDLWDEMLTKFPDEFYMLGVHLYDGDYKAAPFAEKKGWDMPIAVGNVMDPTINRLFYSHRRWGQVWIKDGVFYAAPKWNSLTADLVSDELNGVTVEIEHDDVYAHKKGGVQ